MKTEPDNFPQRLQWMREKRGMNRRALSECCGLSKNMIARYERGEAIPTLNSVIALAEFFEVSVDYLICFHLEN